MSVGGLSSFMRVIVTVGYFLKYVLICLIKYDDHLFSGLCEQTMLH